MFTVIILAVNRIWLFMLLPAPPIPYVQSYSLPIIPTTEAIKNNSL